MARRSLLFICFVSFSTFRPDSFSDHLVARLAPVVKPTAARAGRGLTRRHFFFSPHHFPLFIFYFIISRLSASFRIHFHLISNFLLKNFKEIFSDLIARFFINLNEFVWCFKIFKNYFKSMKIFRFFLNLISDFIDKSGNSANVWLIFQKLKINENNFLKYFTEFYKFKFMKSKFLGFNLTIWQPRKHSIHFQKSPNDWNNSKKFKWIFSN